MEPKFFIALVVIILAVFFVAFLWKGSRDGSLQEVTASLEDQVHGWRNN
jgi:hypothetical protein